METRNANLGGQTGGAENNAHQNDSNDYKNPGKSKNYVYSIKDWKEYLGESLLIIFSVFLALFVTEYINKLHEKANTRDLLKNIVSELKHNKKAIEEMQVYNMHVLGKIDSVLMSKEAQTKIVSNDEFNLDIIAPQGVLYRYLDLEAWTVAKDNNIMSKIDIETISAITKLYEDQGRIVKVEDEIAKVIFDRASRDQKQVHLTLILIRDIYKGWAVDRVPGLLGKIDKVIDIIESEKIK
jgi:hypothetical protein